MAVMGRGFSFSAAIVRNVLLHWKRAGTRNTLFCAVLAFLGVQFLFVAKMRGGTSCVTTVENMECWDPYSSDLYREVTPFTWWYIALIGDTN